MRLEYAFNLIVELERRQIANHLSWNGIGLWPLIRHCLWAELLTDKATKNNMWDFSPAWSQEVTRLARHSVRYLLGYKDFNIPTQSDVTQLFLSRPVYLQALPSGKLFDRIIDPLLSVVPYYNYTEKFYVSPWPRLKKLEHAAKCLTSAHVREPLVTEQHKDSLNTLALAAGLDATSFLHRYRNALRALSGWFETGTLLFSSRPSLTTIYLTSWYFPDMMGLTAAARQRGVRVVDLQHGKQGKFHGMYCGWYDIPPGESGHITIPDNFWCWGQPSCNHILASRPDRRTHRPFIGGFPWLDYYRTHRDASNPSLIGEKKNMRVVLVTTQPRYSANGEPIPDFILDYLRTEPVNIKFIFRCHPNDALGSEYCHHRLASIPKTLVSIDNGQSNLYDQLLNATHHLTAFSSCCYEASAFGIPTLLFGEEARVIYSDDIEGGEFSWSEGNPEELDTWIDNSAKKRIISTQPYIESSLILASKILAQEYAAQREEKH